MLKELAIWAASVLIAVALPLFAASVLVLVGSMASRVGLYPLFVVAVLLWGVFFIASDVHDILKG